MAVESDRMLCTKLRRLAEDKESFEVFCMDVRRALPSLSKRGYKFSLIFADPPYEHGWIKRLLLLLAKYEALLMHDALLVFERSRREKLPLHCKAWKLLKERSYGDTVLSLFKLDLGPRARWNSLAQAVYPGSFDPITRHLYAAERAAALFDELILAVLINPQKRSTFTVEERKTMARGFEPCSNVRSKL